MYGRTETESNGPSEGLQPLSELARQLLPRPDDGALEEKGSEANGALKGRDIVLVQGPAGSGKSLFAWSLYSRFGQKASHMTVTV